MFKLIKIQLKIFASLQTLFPPLKIDIFCRIAPYLSLKSHQNSTWTFRNPGKFLDPCKRCFLLWKLTFSVASSPYLSSKNSSKLSLNFLGPCKRCFLLWKLTFSVASSPLFFIKNMKWKLLEKFVALQTLILPLKIAIFWRIAPLLSPDVPH